MNPSIVAPAFSVNCFSTLEALNALLSPDCALRPIVRLVALALVKHVDKLGQCFPSIARLALCTGLSKRAVIDALAELESSKESPIRVTREHRRTEAGDKTSNLYSLTIRSRKGSAPAAPLVVNEPHPGSAPAAHDPIQVTNQINSGSRAPASASPAPSPTSRRRAADERTSSQPPTASPARTATPRTSYQPRTTTSPAIATTAQPTASAITAQHSPAPRAKILTAADGLNWGPQMSPDERQVGLRNSEQVLRMLRGAA